MVFGYARVSTEEQNEGRQLQAFKAVPINGETVAIDEQYIYVDKASGKDFNRPNYNLLVGSEVNAPLLRRGDVLVVQSLDRFGRDYKKIGEQWQHIINDLGVDIVVLDNELLNTTGASTLEKQLISSLIFEILSYVAQKELENIKERQRQGIARAKSEGKVLGRPKYELPPNWNEVYTQWQNSEITAVKAMELLNMTKASFYKQVKRFK